MSGSTSLRPTAEADVLREVLYYGSTGPTRLFRNNVGKLRDLSGQWIAYGVCNPGGSDLIGWRTVTITTAMVGQIVAQFVALEVKGPRGQLRPAQRQFLTRVAVAGGRAAVVRSADEALVVLA